MFKFFLILIIFYSLPNANAITETRKKLKIATENYPPYEMLEPVDGLKGFDYEVTQEIFNLLNYETDIQFLPWKRALSYTKLGSVVGILTCAYRKEREDFMIFSDPISDFVNGFYVRKGFKGPEPVLLEDVRGQSVGSIVAYESTKALQDIGIKPVEALDSFMAVKMLSVERFDYLYVNQQSADFTIKKLGLSNKFDFYPISKQQFFFCFSKQYEGIEKIVDEFNNALSILKANGTYNKIHNKYQ